MQKKSRYGGSIWRHPGGYIWPPEGSGGALNWVSCDAVWIHAVIASGSAPALRAVVCLAA